VAGAAEYWARRIARRVRSGSWLPAHYVDFQAGLTQLPGDLPALFNLTVDFELGLSRLLTGQKRPNRDEVERECGLYLALLDLAREYKVPLTFAVAARLLADDALKAGERHAFDLLETLGFEPVTHEVGCHSFNHPVFGAEEFTREHAAEDLRQASLTLARRKTQARSFVFPKNKVGHAELLADHSFRVYRGADNRALHQDEAGLWVLPLGLWMGPRALRPADLVRGVREGAAKGALVHYWFHLVEFDEWTELRAFLQPVFATVAELVEAGQIRALTLSDAVDVFDALRVGPFVVRQAQGKR
jgi:peptidoglycan/xylan/chitin deacetylase (PgdA/CDA1 family)